MLSVTICVLYCARHFIHLIQTDPNTSYEAAILLFPFIAKNMEVQVDCSGDPGRQGDGLTATSLQGKAKWGLCALDGKQK